MTVSVGQDAGLSAKDFRRLNSQNTDTAEFAAIRMVDEVGDLTAWSAV